MKIFAGLAVAAGLVVAAGCANARMLAPYDAGRAHFQGASDFEEPYGPPPVSEAPPPRPYGYGRNYDDYGPRYGDGPRYGYGDRPQYGYGPALISLPDVYAVLRDNGFSPLGVPHQRGFVYVIAAIDRAGQDGRLVIDGRNGQIIRFTPAYRWGFDRMRFGPGLPPPPLGSRAALPAPVPPAPIPPLANRMIPAPAPKPVTVAKPAQGPQQGSQQSAAVETKPAAAPPPAQATVPQPQAPQAAAASPPPNATVAQSKPAPQILPTQQMPKAQGLE
jgi:hypothetical protein